MTSTPPPAPTGTLALQWPGGTRFLFDPGALCLELLTTGGLGAYARYESLREPADLAAWLPHSRLRLPADGLRADEAQLELVRELRGALWRLTTARAHGEPGSAEDYALLNRVAAAPPPAPQIAPDGSPAPPLPVDGTQLASALARDAIDLLTGPYAGRIRECAADNCFLVFVDTSRPGRRRWCSMERCGNRHKVRALRARREPIEE